MAERHEVLKAYAESAQSIVVALGVIVGGLWSAATFGALLQTKKAALDVEKGQAEAIIARRNAAPSEIVNAALSVTQLSGPPERFILVEVTLSNGGNAPIKLSLEKKKLYLSRVIKIEDDGKTIYGNEEPLEFQFREMQLTWLLLRPGAAPDKLAAVRPVRVPGIYLARFAVHVPDDAVGPGREYGAQTFFHVK